MWGGGIALSAVQREVDDFRGSIDANGKHVADAVGNDELAVVPFVES